MVELVVDTVTVLNSINVKLPFLPSETGAQLSEEVRLRHRVLDLRYTQTTELTGGHSTGWTCVLGSMSRKCAGTLTTLGKGKLT